MQPILATIGVIGIVYIAWSRQSLTVPGLIVATLTATIYAIHPWSVFYVLLWAFFLAGTGVTKVKHHKKSQLTLSTTPTTSSADIKKPPPRGAYQVLSNSLPATLLVFLHIIYLNNFPLTTINKPHSRLGAFFSFSSTSEDPQRCFKLPPSSTTPHYFPSNFPQFFQSAIQAFGPFLPYGIISNYASAAADTFSSELGILSSSPPFLITTFPNILRLKSPRKVPRGTNGGVTFLGIIAGLSGSALIALTAVLFLPWCTLGSQSAKSTDWNTAAKLFTAITLWGANGSVVDSFLGAFLQASVVDAEKNLVVENEGGGKVEYLRAESGERTMGKGRKLLTGVDLLSNNGVNMLMLFIMSFGGVGLAWGVLG